MFMNISYGRFLRSAPCRIADNDPDANDDGCGRETERDLIRDKCATYEMHAGDEITRVRADDCETSGAFLSALFGGATGWRVNFSSFHANTPEEKKTTNVRIK